MSIHHFTLTLNGSVQSLASGLPTPPGANASVICTEIILQGESGGAAIYIGGPDTPTASNTLSSTNYGDSIPAASVTPFTMRSGVARSNLNSTYVLGTNGNKLHVLYTQL